MNPDHKFAMAFTVKQWEMVRAQISCGTPASCNIASMITIALETERAKIADREQISWEA